jgi:hypothetical protein
MIKPTWEDERNLSPSAVSAYEQARELSRLKKIRHRQAKLGAKIAEKERRQQLRQQRQQQRHQQAEEEKEKRKQRRKQEKASRNGRRKASNKRRRRVHADETPKKKGGILKRKNQRKSSTKPSRKRRKAKPANRSVQPTWTRMRMGRATTPTWKLRYEEEDSLVAGLLVEWAKPLLSDCNY